MTRIADLIGYDVEVSAPDGPAVHGYITARWAESRRADFERALDRIKADVWDACLDEIEKYEINTQQAREGNPYRKEQN